MDSCSGWDGPDLPSHTKQLKTRQNTWNNSFVRADLRPSLRRTVRRGLSMQDTPSETIKGNIQSPAGRVENIPFSQNTWLSMQKGTASVWVRCSPRICSSMSAWQGSWWARWTSEQSSTTPQEEHEDSVTNKRKPTMPGTHSNFIRHTKKQTNTT